MSGGGGNSRPLIRDVGEREEHRRQATLRNPGGARHPHRIYRRTAYLNRGTAAREEKEKERTKREHRRGGDGADQMKL